MNVWDGLTVKIKPGAEVRVWSDETQSAEYVTVPEAESWREYRVKTAIACSFIGGGGSALTLVDPHFPEYQTWCHSSKVVKS